MTSKYNNVRIDNIEGNIYRNQLLINYGDDVDIHGYHYTRINIETNWINLNHYGIPKSDKFHTTEESRRYLQIPLIEGDSFTQFIQSLDKHFNSANFRQRFLDVKQQTFNYIPILKEGKGGYPPSMKFKLDFYNNYYLSEIYQKNPDGNIICEINNMDDVKKISLIRARLKSYLKLIRYGL